MRAGERIAVGEVRVALVKRVKRVYSWRKYFGSLELSNAYASSSMQRLYRTS